MMKIIESSSLDSYREIEKALNDSNIQVTSSEYEYVEKGVMKINKRMSVSTINDIMSSHDLFKRFSSISKCRNSNEYILK